MLSLFLILLSSVLNASENYCATSSFFFFNRKYLFCIYRYCFVRLCEEEAWGFSVSKFLKYACPRDVKDRIDSNAHLQASLKVVHDDYR